MTHLGLITYLVPDYDEAIGYFTGPLGFDLVEDSELGGGRRWVVVRPAGAGSTGLLLAEPADDEQRAALGSQAGGRVFLFLHTDDFAADHARMSAAGVVFREAPRHEPYGTVAVFEDRYGHHWDLIQPRR